MHVVRAKKMEGFIMRKKLLSILCAFSLVLTPVPVSAETVQEINQEPLVKVLTLSDYQKWSSTWTDDWDFLQNQLTNIVDGAYDAGADPDYMLFGGDFTCLGNTTAESITGMTQVKDIIRSKWDNLTDDKMVLVQGNHDLAGDYGLAQTGPYYFDDFIIYVVNEDDYPSKQAASGSLKIVQNTTNDLKQWMNERITAKETRPILIASHTGLHYDIDRMDGNNQYASILFDAINEAAKQLDIVFFFGHNHTNGDERVGGSLTFYTKGDKLDVCTTTSIAEKSGTSKKLNFTYMNYGYVGYIGDIHNQPTTETPTDLLTVSQLNFFGDRIEIARYSADGLESEYGRTITLRNYPEWANLPECRLTLDVNGGDGSNQEFVTVESDMMLDKSNVPTKSGFLFDGWAENADGSGTIYKVGDEIHLDRDLVLYAQWRELPAGQQYVLSESLKPGKQYIMVWNSDIADNSGKKYAMTANGTELGTTLLSDENFVTDNMLILPDEADTSPYTWDVIWNQGVNPAQGYLLQNLATKEYLCHASATLALAEDPIGIEAAIVPGGHNNSSIDMQKYTWNYRDYKGYKQISRYGDESRYIRYSVGSAKLKFGSTSVSTDVNNSNVYLYEKVEPVQYRWELADSLESNERYLIVSAGKEGSAKAMTATGRTIGTADVDIRSDENGELYIDYTAVYGDAAVFYSYLIREGNYWLDSWNSISDGGVLRLNGSSAGITSSHGDNSYYFRFTYKEGALAAYGGLASTNTRTLVYNNGFTVGLGNNVYLYKLVPVVEHSYGGWEVVKEATCTEAGEKIQKCTKCEASRTESISPLGHDWESDYTIDEEPTYTKEGSKSRHCKRCDAVTDQTPVLRVELPFEEVSGEDWFYNEVAAVYEEGLMTGLNKAIFAPYESLSRAQFAVILHRMENAPEAEYDNLYEDVADGEWYTKAIAWASEKGVVTGYSDTGKFGPADSITREQMLVMLYRYANMKGYDTSIKADFNSYKDASKVSVYAKEAMQWAVGNGIVTGKFDKTLLDPQERTVRMECAIVLARFLEKY